MKFIKMELSGFKSFADKQVIEFGDGITAIVGPNGCGKSNVSDAIRWVLGEKSAKAMRGESMQDVIFSGTVARKSLSYCEVTLYFDNSDRAMPMLDYDEVAFTRKLFRSGESEYYINKQQCLQRDIINNLRDGGIAKEGYTIIGQGRVAEILNSQPEARRAIFEEATGIMEFKQKKKETENSLARTHDNYLRLSDQIVSTESVLFPLEKQAEKTKKSRVLKEELKHHEINVFISQQENSASEREKINTKIQGLVEQYELRKRESEQASKEYEEVFEKINLLETKLNGMQDKYSDMRVSMENKSGQVRLFKERTNSLESKKSGLATEITDNKNLQVIKKQQIAFNSSKKESIKSELSKLIKKAEELQIELNKVDILLSRGEELADKSREQVLKSMESLSDININKGTITNEKENLILRKTELEQKIKQVAEKGASLMEQLSNSTKTALEKEESIQKIRQSILDIELDIRSRNEDISRDEAELVKLRTNKSIIENKVNWYTDIKNSYGGYNDSVKKLMNLAKDNRYLKDKIKGTVAEIIKFDSKYDYAIQTVLSGAEQSVVTDNPEDAKTLINYLKKNGIGRVKFLPITSVKYHHNGEVISSAIKEAGVIDFATNVVEYNDYYENVVFHLLGNTLVVDNIDNATNIAKKYSFQFRIVTLDGDILSNQGTMSGGAKQPQKMNAVLSNDRLLESLKLDLNKIITSLDDKEAEITIKQNSRDDKLDEYEKLKESLQEVKHEITLLKEKSVSYESSLGEAKMEKDALEDSIKVVEQKLEQITYEYEKITTGSQELEQMKRSASTEVAKNQEEYEKLKEKRSEIINGSTSVQIEITAKKADIMSLDAENVRLESEILSLSEQVEVKEEEIKKLEKEIEDVRQSEEMFSLSQEDQTTLKTMREQIESERAKYSKLKDSLSRLSESKTLLNEQMSLIEGRKHTEELALSKLNSDLEHAEIFIQEQYNETYSSALRFKEENYDRKFGKQEVSRLKKEISQLGAINENAIEDALNMRFKYEEDIKQRDDIKKAEDDLNNALAKIRDQMLEQFNAGFVKINENFGKIFKELFGGGRAMLEMDYTNSDDKLEAGVIIVAEPPGKKQKLSLLSGGEQTLTAIAILFAILRLKPMPFCVLDEIEAALDEANVVRFTNYLQKFAQETQFVVITHKKQTMEAANALFGVTMQEKGVTKTVSVKLSDIKIDEKNEATITT